MNRTAPMRRTAMKRGTAPAARPARQMEYTPRPRTAATAVADPSAVVRAAPKEVRFSSEAWIRAVASIPCVFCGAPSQAAHRNEGKGTGWKTDDCLVAALCPPEHAEIDQGKSMDRDEKRARLDQAIVLTLRELARRGWLKVRTE